MYLPAEGQVACRHMGRIDEHLEISEAISLAPRKPGESLFNEDGTIDIHVIRPGIGRGKGKHLYEAKMLEENAHVFGAQRDTSGKTTRRGWKMYVDHLGPEARKAAGGLPRKVWDLGGRVVESWWDPDVPGDDRHEQGAVVGRVRPVRAIRELIEDDPELLEASISATATGVKPVERNGQRVWLVEGIGDRGSVDWVSEAGAGGRVRGVLESVYSDEREVELALLEALDDAELEEHLRAQRPELIEALGSGGGVRPPAAPSTSEEDDMADLTPAALQEALSKASDEEKTTLLEALGLGSIEDTVNTLVEQRAEVIRAEARADAAREVELARLASVAERRINEASFLPAEWRTDLQGRFTLTEAGDPTPELDRHVSLYDDKGALQKTAEESLREAVDAEVERYRALLGAARPTVVRGNGGGGSDSDGKPQPLQSAKSTSWGAYLQEHGVNPDKAYRLETAGERA